jgi:hypothetical protein
MLNLTTLKEGNVYRLRFENFCSISEITSKYDFYIVIIEVDGVDILCFPLLTNVTYSTHTDVQVIMNSSFVEYGIICDPEYTIEIDVGHYSMDLIGIIPNKYIIQAKRLHALFVESPDLVEDSIKFFNMKCIPMIKVGKYIRKPVKIRNEISTDPFATENFYLELTPEPESEYHDDLCDLDPESAKVFSGADCLNGILG